MTSCSKIRITFLQALLSVIIFTIGTQNGYTQTGIDKPRYQVVTHRAGNFLGTFNLELFPLIAPLHVNNFDSLVAEQFYDSTAFHRVVPGFVIQGGDPNSISGPTSTWGQGQPWQPTVQAEFNPVRHVRGILGAARSTNPNSATSQYYICVANATFLDNNYTVYGKVTSGMDVVDTIVSSPTNGNELPLQKIEMFITYTGVNDTVPDAPTLNSPADASSGILNTQTFICNTVSDAVLYHFEFSTDPSFATIDYTTISGANATMVTQLQGFTTYYWRAIANNGGHLSTPSNVYSFTTATGAPDLIYPANGATNIPTNLAFTWTTAQGATDYTLQVSVSSTFTTQNMIYNQAGLVDTFQVVTGLNPNSTYYWRLRSANGANQGFFSAKHSFSTGTSTGIEDLIDENASLSLNSVYPVPANNELNLEYFIREPGELTVEVFDLLDRSLILSQKNVPYGKGNTTLNLEGLSTGNYVLTLRINDKRLARPFQVVR